MCLKLRQYYLQFGLTMAHCFCSAFDGTGYVEL